MITVHTSEHQAQDIKVISCDKSGIRTMRIAFLIIFFIGIFMKNIKAEQMFQLHSPTEISIDGRAMKALKIACDEFLVSGKDIREFNITISENADKKKNDVDNILIVTFMGKLSPSKRGLGTANRVPGSVIYFVSRENWKIIKEQGVK